MSNKLTCAQLGAALAAVEAAGLDRDAGATRAVNALVGALTLHATRDSEPVRVADGELSVTVEQVEEAIAELSEPEVGLARQHLKSLKIARDLLAQEVKRRAAEETAECGEFITRKEFSSFAVAVACALSDLEAARERTGFADSDLRVRLRDRIGTSSSERGAAVARLLELLEDIRERDGIARRKRAQDKGRVVNGESGFNW